MVSERFAEESLGKYRAIATVTSAESDEKMTATVAKARAYKDPEFLAATEEMNRAYSYRKIIEAIYNNTERKSILLSRELTRRIGRNDREGRAQKWQS